MEDMKLYKYVLYMCRNMLLHMYGGHVAHKK